VYDILAKEGTRQITFERFSRLGILLGVQEHVLISTQISHVPTIRYSCYMLIYPLAFCNTSEIAVLSSRLLQAILQRLSEFGVSVFDMINYEV
jgi:hypothetical protein